MGLPGVGVERTMHQVRLSTGHMSSGRMLVVGSKSEKEQAAGVNRPGPTVLTLAGGRCTLTDLAPGSLSSLNSIACPFLHH